MSVREFSAAATSDALALKAMSAVSDTPGPPSPKLNRYWPPVALTVTRCTSLASGLLSCTSKDGAAAAGAAPRLRRIAVKPIDVIARRAPLLSLLTSDLPARGRLGCLGCRA